MPQVVPSPVSFTQLRPRYSVVTWDSQSVGAGQTVWFVNVTGTGTLEGADIYLYVGASFAGTEFAIAIEVDGTRRDLFVSLFEAVTNRARGSVLAVNLLDYTAGRAALSIVAPIHFRSSLKLGVYAAGSKSCIATGIAFVSLYGG